MSPAITYRVHEKMLSVLSRFPSRAPLVFTLHRQAQPEAGIGGHEAATVKAQLEILLRHQYRLVTLDIIDAWVNGADIDMTKTAALAFDDGYWDQADLIRNVFLPLGVPASVFLITDFIDGLGWPWDTRVKWLIYNAPTQAREIRIDGLGASIPIGAARPSRRRAANAVVAALQYKPPEQLESSIARLAEALDRPIPETPPACHRAIAWSEARQLESNGIRFGSHSRRHYILPTMTDVQVDDQLRGSLARIRSELTAPLSMFCYPFGGRADFGGRELLLLGDTGYSSAVTMIQDHVSRPRETNSRHAYLISRYSLPETVPGLVKAASSLPHLRSRIQQASPARLMRDRYGSLRGLARRLEADLQYRLGQFDPREPIDWSWVHRIVFVCHGNVCRSPFAEAIARERGIPTVSYGLRTDQGTRSNPIASRLALEMGIDMTRHQSRLLRAEALKDGDLVLGMEPSHLLHEAFSLTEANVRRHLLGLLHPRSKSPYIHDPYGLSDAYFRRCLTFIRSAVYELADSWLTSRASRVAAVDARLQAVDEPTVNWRPFL